MGIYDFQMKDAEGNAVDLSGYRGKVLLIVNTATRCGLTRNTRLCRSCMHNIPQKAWRFWIFRATSSANRLPKAAEKLPKCV